jgi:hypothetical protein
VTQAFYGFIEKMEHSWNTNENLDIIKLQAYSFAAKLSEKMVDNFEISYKDGYGEIIKTLVGSRFCTEEVGIERKSGSVIFHNISVLDALRHIAYVRGWCLKFDGKKIIFGPCKKPVHTGITLKKEDIQIGSMSFGRDISRIIDRKY